MKDDRLHPAIIIPAYNRPQAIRLLLSSLNSAFYPSADIPLIISLEYDSAEEVVKVAEEFEFKSGNKTIVRAEHKMGLKSHILKCGDYAEKFGSAVVIEDDLMVAPGFYKFASDALRFYQDDERIAGISLYSQRFNESARLPFEPMPSSWSAYFMQLTSSWGVGWTSSQWKNFKKWLHHKEKTNDFDFSQLPENVQNWPAMSWKKLYNLYIVEQNKYFVYPYQSYTTNNADFGGTNIHGAASQILQVPLSYNFESSYNFEFPDLNKKAVCYDIYIESIIPYQLTYLSISNEEVELDLYGIKSNSKLITKKYFITPRTGNEPIKSYPLRLKPIEANILSDLQCDGKPFFHLYRSEQADQLKPLSKHQYFQLAEHLSYLQFKTKPFLIGFVYAFMKKIISRLLFRGVHK